MGRVEEAIRWTEKAGGEGADASSPLGKTSRALASAYLAWAREDAQKAGRKDEAERLRERARRIAAVDTENAGNVRVVVTWSHPEFHPDLWSNGLGAPMPAPDGNPLLGVAETVLPASKTDSFVELRMEKADAERAARLGAQATLTAITNEGAPDERIARLVVAYGRDPGSGAAVRRFSVDGGSPREVTP